MNKQKAKFHIKLLLNLAFALFFLPSSSQNILKFNLRLTITKGNYDHVVISITRNGAEYQTIDSRSKYDLEFEMGYEYIITATKMGYITKSVVVNTKIPDKRDEEDFAFFKCEIVLNPQPEEAEITYTQPVGLIKYDVAFGDFDYDKDYTAKSQIEQKIAEAKPKPKPKPKKDTIVSKPIPIEAKVEYKPEPNPPKIVPKPVVPPPAPLVKNIVERFVQQERVKITFRTVTINGVDFVYKKEEHSWGGVYFYKNDKNIIESTFEKDTN